MAALSMVQLSARPACFTVSVNTASAIGDLQMLPDMDAQFFIIILSRFSFEDWKYIYYK